jgi:hypothetical protein
MNGSNLVKPMSSVASEIDYIMWPERLGAIAAAVEAWSPGLFDVSCPGAFLHGLRVGAFAKATDIAVDDTVRDSSTDEDDDNDEADPPGANCLTIGGNVASPHTMMTAINTLLGYELDEVRVAAVHPTNDNDEQSNAAKFRHHDDRVYHSADLIALCAVTGLRIRVDPDGMYDGVVYAPIDEPTGLLRMSHHFGFNEWTVEAVVPL